MKKTHLILASVFVMILSACSKDNNQLESSGTFYEIYGGNPFKGTARGVRSQNGVDDYTWNGDGRIALIEATPDSVSMVFMADFDELGEINFKVRGKYDHSTYRMDTADPTLFFRIIDEQITGSINNAQQEMSFEGSMQKETTTMSMHVFFKEENGPFAKGSSLLLTFDTRRKVSDDDNGEGCQMRLVPIWGPSGMTMGMVPDC